MPKMNKTQATTKLLLLADASHTAGHTESEQGRRGGWEGDWDRDWDWKSLRVVAGVYNFAITKQ